MAFRKDKTGSAQTAANAAAVLVSAFADKFRDLSEAVEAYHELRTDIFEDLSKVVEADNEVFAAAEASETPKPRSGGGSKTRERKTGGGGKRKGGGGGGSISLDDALNMELNFGAFEGETLGDVLKFSAEECDDDYGYGDGERDGEDYIAWLASDRNKNDFVQRRARIIADAEGLSYDG